MIDTLLFLACALTGGVVGALMARAYYRHQIRRYTRELNYALQIARECAGILKVAP